MHTLYEFRVLQHNQELLVELTFIHFVVQFKNVYIDVRPFYEWSC